MASVSVKSKENLLESLEIIFQEIKEDKKAQMEVDEILSQHNIPRGTLNEAMVDLQFLNTLPQEELMILIEAINTATGKIKISLIEYFTKQEVKKSVSYKREVAEKASLPYTFRNVLKSSEQDFLTTMECREIARLFTSEVLTYNIETQRNPKRTFLKNGTIKVTPRLNKTSVDEITKLMLDGRYRSNTIVFNVLMDGTENVEFDDGDLTVISGQLNIIDGFHRLQAILNTLEKNPDYDGNMDVAIKYLSLEEAKFYLGQINKMSKMDKTYVKRLMSLELSDQVTNRLDSNSLLKGRISTDTTLIKKFGYLTNFSVLSKAIEDVFKPEKPKDVIDQAAFLKDFFDYLINSFEDEFGRDIKKLDAVKKVSWINHHNTFVGLIALAKKIYDNKIPIPKIVDILNGIDFTRQEGLPYNDVISPQGKVNAYTIKNNIKTFFEKIEI
jgi:hypothetical protein